MGEREQQHRVVVSENTRPDFWEGVRIVELTYMMQPPKRWTFTNPRLRKWVEQHCKGHVLNLFAGKTLLTGVYETRVDINPDMERIEFPMDAYTFVQEWIKLLNPAMGRQSLVCSPANSSKPIRPEKFDTIILDPPYTIRKGREKYGGKYIGRLTRIKNLLPQILSENGRVISLGYDSVGMSASRGFRKIALCVVCHSGDHNDTLCLVEEQDPV